MPSRWLLDHALFAIRGVALSISSVHADDWLAVSAEVLDELYELAAVVAVGAREREQLACSGEHQPALGCAGDPYRSRPGGHGRRVLTCMQSWDTDRGVSFQVAVLLNAQAPGQPPGELWGATPVSGHPGVVHIAAVQEAVRLRPGVVSALTAPLTREHGAAYAKQQAALITRRYREPFTIVPSTVARRVGALPGCSSELPATSPSRSHSLTHSR